jgi:hypothetical protein|tara:strand:+ start:13498 stop:13689 length:192 start_codon:yes stop_codon:yes gene_type:complete
MNYIGQPEQSVIPQQHTIQHDPPDPHGGVDSIVDHLIWPALGAALVIVVTIAVKYYLTKKKKK